MTLEGLCRAVAARIAPGLAGWAMQAAVIVLVWTRIRRAQGRILGLLAEFQAGRLRVRVRTGVRPGGGGDRKGDSSGLPRDPTAKLPHPTAKLPHPTAKLPRRFAWLIPLVPYEAAGFASQLRVLLAEPEMIGLLAASAQARRILAPVCRMLGIEAAVLTPVVSPVVDEVAAVKFAFADAAAPPASDHQSPGVPWFRQPLLF